MEFRKYLWYSENKSNGTTCCMDSYGFNFCDIRYLKEYILKYLFLQQLICLFKYTVSIIFGIVKLIFAVFTLALCKV